MNDETKGNGSYQVQINLPDGTTQGIDNTHFVPAVGINYIWGGTTYTVSNVTRNTDNDTWIVSLS